MNTALQALLQQAVRHHRQQRLEAAQELYRQCLSIDAACLPALYYAGVLALQRQQPEEGRRLLEELVRLDPNSAQGWYHLGLAFERLGDSIGAERAYRESLRHDPAMLAAGNNLSRLLRAQGRLGDATSLLSRLSEAIPDSAEVHLNQGLVAHALGQLERAKCHFQRSVEIDPGTAEAVLALGLTLADLGDFGGAVQLTETAIKRFPRRAAEGLLNLGSICQDKEDLGAAETAYRRALACDPGLSAARLNLAIVLHDQGKLDEALVTDQETLAARPDFAEAHNNIGHTLKDLGRFDEAAASYREALRLKAGFAEAYSNLLFLHGYHVFLAPQAYLALARGWESACIPDDDRQAARRRTFRRSSYPGRRLKVGYVSGDFRQHAVSHFIEQVFANHDRGRIELYAYPTRSADDTVNSRLKASAEHWVPLVAGTDAAVRDRIAADAIDVLVDLSGHTANNRLGVFARRAAPVQTHYLGYNASAGLTEMDYSICDHVLAPPEADDHFSEVLWRLPRVWVSYDGHADAPEPRWRPANDGAVWLGSFNALGKITIETLSLWARVLTALPEARLLLKARELGDESNRIRIAAAMAELGIHGDRIALRSRDVTPGWAEHMAYYDRLDIALDPVGAVGGGTTTCDALWMGVPVVTLAGDRMASRMSSSMLNAIGHPEWVACDSDDYVARVRDLARDLERRRNIRPHQREQMLHSPLCDAKGLCRVLEDAYQAMFERWLKASAP